MALTKVSYSMITGAPANVKDFGATGDGVTNDTAAIQAAVDHCVLTGNSLYVPTGQYLITGINIVFPGTLAVGTRKQGFVIYGDGGFYERAYGSAGFGNSTFIYAGTSGSAIQTSGGWTGGMVIRDIVIRGTGGTRPATEWVGTTATGLKLVGCTDHKLDGVCITGFEKGLHAIYCFIGVQTNCHFVQNNINAHYDSANNNITCVNVNYHVGFKAGILIRNEYDSSTVRDMVFIAPLLESCTIGVVIDPVGSDIRGINFISPYFEENAEFFRFGYSIAGVESAQSVSEILIDSIGYTGALTPTNIVKASKLSGLRIEQLSVAYSVLVPFDFSSSVNRVFIAGHDFFGSGFTMPLLPQAFSQSLQRSVPYNLVAGGNYLASGGSFLKTTVTLVESYSLEDNCPVLTLTVPTGTSTLFWPIYNATNVADKSLQFMAAIRGAAGVTTQVGLFTAAGASISSVLSGFSTSAIEIKALTVTPPAGNAAIQVRCDFNNTSGTTQQVKIRSIGLFFRTAGPILTDALDVLVSMSGTVTCSPTATVNVPFNSAYGASDYRVVVTPYANVTFYITKAAGSFTITCSSNADVDYIVLPRGRLLA